jgi:GNAT superfamily N-acetyltransferase
VAEDYHIVHIKESKKIPWEVIGGWINSYNEQQAGDDKSKRVCFALQGPDDEIVGGVIGVIYWDWFCIDLMYLKEAYRNQGYGHRLLTLAEEEARNLGAKHVHLDTFSFQAPNFYKKHGYKVFGELDEFPAGHQRYYMTKEL